MYSVRFELEDKLVKKHIYIIDTCVLLHDPKCIYKFEDNDIYIPLAVIDDLDIIKTKKDLTGWAARSVFRELDTFPLSDLMGSGCAIPGCTGKLFVYNPDTINGDTAIKEIVRTNSDDALIEACVALQAKFSDHKVSIVTKDTGLRVRANSWMCNAENYKHDMLDQDNFYTGSRTIHVKQAPVDDELIVEDFSPAVQETLKELSPHEFVVFQNTKTATIYKHSDGILKRMDHLKHDLKLMKVSPRNDEQKCAMSLLMDENIPMVCLTGKAGTGKTLLTLACALEQINKGIYDKIIVIKPIIPVGGRDIGALPGDKWEKLSPWLGPIRDNLMQLLNKTNMPIKKGKGKDVTSTSPITFEDVVNEGLIEPEAMVYIQGRSIPRSIIILDESQNLTAREARMVIERCGEGSKVVLLGDLSQIENPYLDRMSSGLAHAMNGAKIQPLCGSMLLKEVTRSPLSAAAGEIFKTNA